MKFKFAKVLILSACFVFALALQVNGQEFKYQVEKDRLIGHRDGELIISDKGVTYQASKHENESRAWSYGDIKLFEILSPIKVRIWTYNDRKLLSKDENLTFKIVGARVDQKLSDFLRERIARPFVTSFVQSEAASLAQVPVKHSHRFGAGCEGILKVYPDKLEFESTTGHDSRSWRWTDIRSVGRSDNYRFEVETFEPQAGVSSRSFDFVLKEQMDDNTYDLIWNRVYRPTPLIRVRDRKFPG